MAEAPLIAHVLFRLDTGGMENGVVNLINTMPRDSFRHAIITLAGATDFARRIHRPDVAIHSIDKRPGKDPAAYWRFLRLVRRLHPAIVHTRNLGTVDCQPVAALAGVPIRIHGEHGWHFADLDGRAARGLRVRRVCSPFVHHYVAMSQDIARWLSDVVGIAPARITQIYNGVDTSRFSPEGPAPAGLPWAGGPRPRLVIGTVGRIEPTKNQGLILKAFSRLLELVPSDAADLRLMIIGSGPQLQQLRDEAQRLVPGERVWLPGQRDDIPALMRAMDVFVLPSLNEGISNTILEAMATALPVVASRVGGNGELVVEGITGELFDPGDVDRLAAHLLTLLRDPSLRRQYGDAGRERVQRSFTMSAMVDGYTLVYESLMHGRA